jgi:uncharacterized protein YdaU (DUF1376 family)
MHYYQFNIGDYASHTKHLNPIEDICYRRSLDYYYLHEKPLTNDIAKLSRLLMLNDYQIELMTILEEFFVCVTKGYINPRADKEIKQYKEFSEAGKRGAAKRWLKTGNEDVIGGLSGGVSGANAKQETLTKNHKPITNNHKPSTGEVCLAIKENGIIDVNPSNPTLMKLIEAGATVNNFSDAAKVCNVKKFAYLLKVIESDLEKASNLNVKSGVIVSKQQKREEDLQWFLGNQPAIEKDITHG